ncbi:DUF2948 family protein [Ahrensia kielensis]|uniref:DUF2948 family protein n=1 Tax=Ahrensia kielensis TaxID=76980 RepID=UPI000370DDDA|nr:DUF2948 family protein [Ahrensia kielensis]
MADLKLIAMDDADLAVISAHVQDAVCKPAMFEYTPASRQFSLVLNRFSWDAAKNERKDSYQRHGSVLTFAGVNAVRTRGIQRGSEEQVLSLLAVQFSADNAPAGTIEIVFSDGPILQLDVECIEVRLNDLGSAWETKFKPRHPLA